MKIQLIDRNNEMCEQWKLFFQNCDDVIVYNGDFFDLDTDCVVSPANSFGFMDGGLDFVISDTLGWDIQRKLQIAINEKYDGELLVGQAELIETGNLKVPYCISAPTMRIPLILTDSVNVYLASKAIFRVLKQNENIKSVTISGLGTGTGDVPFRVCAKQMRQAYEDVWLSKDIFPDTLRISMKKHQSLLY
jgi:O-acetyl-ADP-ribose deacetylase (regulator of RNase III)